MGNGRNGKRGQKVLAAVEDEVRKTYALGAQERLENLCCPVSYNPQYLAVIPKEIIEKDYGCGDPSCYVREGDHVLDLGSGGGKICFIASQIVGPKGRVIGIDFNDEMLALARKYQREVGSRIGYHNVEFKKGKIQDLKTNLELLESYLKKCPVNSAESYLKFETYREEVIHSEPLVPDESVDVIISNCVLNLVKPEDKQRLFSQMYRVLRRGGRVAISDIVSDEDVPHDLQKDPELWTGCISGAFREDLFLRAFEETGFYGVKIEAVTRDPFRTVRGIEFRSVTVTAHKGKEGPCLERNQAVIYKGPWKEVRDDDQHVLERGMRTAVCDKTYHLFSQAPYKDNIILVPPRKEVPYAKAGVFDCHRSAARHPRETKGKSYKQTKQASGPACEPGNACCP